MIPFNHWSYSKLNTYLRCPAQFMFRYIEEAEPESTSIALLLGSAVHGAATYRAARTFQVDLATNDEILARFRELLAGSVQNSPVPVHFGKKLTDLDSNLDLGTRMLSAYLERRDRDHVVALEQELQSRLRSSDGTQCSLPLLGFIDSIEQDPDGALLVVELKTSARAWSQVEADMSAQITSYAILMKEAGFRNVRFRFEIITKTKEPKVQLLDTSRTDDDLDRLVRGFLMLERAIEAGVFPRNESPMNCSGCSFRNRCASSSA